MLIEVIFSKVGRNLVEVAVFETIDKVVRLITAGTSPQHHALAYNLVNMAKNSPQDWKFTPRGPDKFIVEEI